KSRAANVANDRVSVNHRAQPVEQIVADAACVLLQLLVVYHVEHRDSYRARHGVAAERTEILHAVVERIRDRARGGDRTDRMSVAQWLAHHDYVGHDTLILKRPEARSHATQAGLHFVGDAHAALLSNILIDVRQISGRQHDLAAHTWACLGDKCRRPKSMTHELVD